jgi:hypothetical protein
MRTLVVLRWLSSGRQILLTFVLAVILVFGTSQQWREAGSH